VFVIYARAVYIWYQSESPPSIQFVDANAAFTSP
jgi:hypothetical protein